MNLFSLFTEDDLEKAVAERLVNIRDDGAGLRILNYSDAALYTDGAWDNPAVWNCRGIIVDGWWDVVARPWAKFFNYGQVEAGEVDLAAPVQVTDKMDGSLGIVHLTVDGVPRVASRGSFESDQAIHATAVLHACHPGLMLSGGVTPLVEIIYPANRIVVDYGDRDDLVLLGGVVIETGEYLGPDETATRVGWNGPQTEVFTYATLRDALAAPARPGMEGFCARRLDSSHIVKIKQEEYIRLHRIVTGLSERTVWEHMMAERPLSDLLGGLPDELHGWTRTVWERIADELDSIAHKALDVHADITNALETPGDRKQYAALAQQYADVRPYLFNLLDGRNPRPGILRTLKPFGDTRARTISEAVA